MCVCLYIYICNTYLKIYIYIKESWKYTSVSKKTLSNTTAFHSNKKYWTPTVHLSGNNIPEHYSFYHTFDQICILGEHKRLEKQEWYPSSWMVYTRKLYSFKPTEDYLWTVKKKINSPATWQFKFKKRILPILSFIKRYIQQFITLNDSQHWSRDLQVKVWKHTWFIRALQRESQMKGTIDVFSFLWHISAFLTLL